MAHITLQCLLFEGTTDEAVNFVNSMKSFNDGCRKYQEDVMAWCREGLTAEESDLFNRYMAGGTTSRHPDIAADMEGSHRVGDAILQAISWGLG